MDPECRTYQSDEFDLPSDILLAPDGMAPDAELLKLMEAVENDALVPDFTAPDAELLKIMEAVDARLLSPKKRQRVLSEES